MSLFRSSLIASLLAVTSAVASAQIVFSNLGEASYANVSIFPDEGGTGAATPFTTGNAAAAYRLNEVSIDLWVLESGSFFLSLYSSNGTTPETELELLSGLESPATGINSYLSSGFNLTANTSYWLVATASNGSIYALNTTDSLEHQGSWSTNSPRFRYDGQWDDTGPQSVMLSISATAIPEPSTYAAIVGALALGFVAYRRRCVQS